MGTNSIRVNMTKEDIISEIQLLKSADIERKSVYLIVEGTDDIKFFNKRLSSDIQIYESFSGCNGVREIVEHFSHNKIIGICDRDYDLDYYNKKIFFYDFNCLEMMLISNDVVFESVCNACFIGNISFDKLRELILKDLLLISVFRKINFLNKMGINFKKMSISNLYDLATHKIDVAKIRDEIDSDIMVQKRADVARLTQQNTTYESFLEITNGHDFIDYLQKIFELNKIPKTKTQSSDSILMMLITSFRKSDFKKTELFHSLENAEAIFGYKIVA